MTYGRAQDLKQALLGRQPKFFLIVNFSHFILLIYFIVLSCLFFYNFFVQFSLLFRFQGSHTDRIIFTRPVFNNTRRSSPGRVTHTRPEGSHTARVKNHTVRVKVQTMPSTVAPAPRPLLLLLFSPVFTVPSPLFFSAFLRTATAPPPLFFSTAVPYRATYLVVPRPHQPHHLLLLRTGPLHRRRLHLLTALPPSCHRPNSIAARPPSQNPTSTRSVSQTHTVRVLSTNPNPKTTRSVSQTTRPVSVSPGRELLSHGPHNTLTQPMSTSAEPNMFNERCSKRNQDRPQAVRRAPSSPSSESSPSSHSTPSFVRSATPSSVLVYDMRQEQGAMLRDLTDRVGAIEDELREWRMFEPYDSDH